MLATLAHGGSVVYAGRDFDAKLVANALVAERCTVLHGVPTMFSAILEVLRQKGRKIDSIRTGIAAGSKVPPPLVAELRGRMGFKDTAITYGQPFHLFSARSWTCCIDCLSTWIWPPMN